MKKLIVAASLAALSATAMAQNGNDFYGEIGYGFMEYKEGSYSPDIGTANLKLGYNINKNFSVEVLAATTVNDGSVTVGATNVDVEIDHAFGAYLKGNVEVAKDFQLFARVGVTRAKMSASANVSGITVSSSGSDISYGVGAQYNFTKDMYGQIDYMNYYDKNGISVKGPSISIGFNF